MMLGTWFQQISKLSALNGRLSATPRPPVADRGGAIGVMNRAYSGGRGASVYSPAGSVAGGAAAGAGFAAFLTAAFLPGARFSADFAGAFFAACSALAASACFNAQRFLVAAMIFLRPAALSLRLGVAASFDGGGGAGSLSFLASAHLFRCASAIAFLPAALIFRRLRCGGSGVASGSVGLPDRVALSSAILESISRFCSSNPRMAAVIISLVRLVGILALCIVHVTAIIPVRE